MDKTHPKDLTDKQKKWLNHLLTSRILYTISIGEINEMNSLFGVGDRYKNIEACISFCKAINQVGRYGTISDDKKLNAIREVYLMYKQ